MSHSGTPCNDLCQQGHERGIEQDDLVGGVSDDLLDLLWEESRIDRVQDQPVTRNRQVGFEVGHRVPHEGANTRPIGELKATQRARQTPGPGDELGDSDPAHALTRRVVVDGEDRNVTVQRLGVADDRRDR